MSSTSLKDRDVLSPSFFAKGWTQYELDGLVAREVNGGKVILPLWHKVSKDQVLDYRNAGVYSELA
jgi:hypothetical protein